jgi:hypothetical protein
MLVQFFNLNPKEGCYQAGGQTLKQFAKSLSQHGEKNGVPTPLS